MAILHLQIRLGTYPITGRDHLDYGDMVAQGLARLTKWFDWQGSRSCGMAFSRGAIFEQAYEIRAAPVSELFAAQWCVARTG